MMQRLHNFLSLAFTSLYQRKVNNVLQDYKPVEQNPIEAKVQVHYNAILQEKKKKKRNGLIRKIKMYFNSRFV